MKTEILDIHHASLLVADTTRALDFYCSVLGLQPLARPDLGFPGAWLAVGERQIHLLELPSPDPREGRPGHGGCDRHLALSVARLEPLEQAVKQAGISFHLSRSGRRALFCRDPDGNTLEFVEISKNQAPTKSSKARRGRSES